MLLHLLKVKIQSLIVSESSLAYPGSITLPQDILDAAGIRPFEQVHVHNKNKGHRIITYAVRGAKPGFVSVNGAASHLFSKGDTVHVLAYAMLDEREAAAFSPTLVRTGDDNGLLECGPYTFD